MPGRFVAVEGGDGAGKGSVIAALAAALRATGQRIFTTREPGGTREGNALRALLLAEQAAWVPQAELLLMVAARVQHVRTLIEPALADGQTVLCDRFIGSTIAYQGAGRGLDIGSIRTLHRHWLGDVQPDRTLLLDVPPEVGLARSRSRLELEGVNEGKFEALDLAFHTRVCENFLYQARTNTSWVVIDATQPLDQVIAEARAALMQ